MRFRNLHKWTLSNDTEGLLFFAQRISELLFDYTLDTYKPSALNAPFLCREALSLIEDIEDGSTDESNLQQVAEELFWSIRGDKVSKKLLDIPLDGYILDGDQVPLSQKKLRLEVLASTLNPNRYLEACKALLMVAVAEHKKIDIDLYARSLITTLINLGISKASLHDKCHSYFFDGDEPRITGASNLAAFLKLVDNIGHDFDVYFIASKEIKDVKDSIGAFKIEVLEELPEPLKAYADSHSFFPKHNETIISVGGIQACDCYTARERAESRLETLKDLFTLFFHRNDLSWRKEALLSQCCIKDPIVIGSPKGAMEKAFDLKPAYASKRLNWMLKNLMLRHGGASFKRFNRIVDLHGISVTSDIPENQLLNLWIALETLVPSHSGTNKISNVVSQLTPFIKTTYIPRIIDTAVRDLMIWNGFSTKRILKKVPSPRGSDIKEKVTRLLALPEHVALREELYADLRDFHLLRFRLYSLAEKFKDADSVRELLETHQKKVAWQLRRLYRTRNMLVHSGKTPEYLGILIENAHDYLDLVVNEIVQTSCGEYRVKTIEQAFDLQKLMLQRFEASLPAGKVPFTDENVSVLAGRRPDV